jgi:hypothetical protein
MLPNHWTPVSYYDTASTPYGLSTGLNYGHHTTVAGYIPPLHHTDMSLTKDSVYRDFSLDSAYNHHTSDSDTDMSSRHDLCLSSDSEVEATRNFTALLSSSLSPSVASPSYAQPQPPPASDSLYSSFPDHPSGYPSVFNLSDSDFEISSGVIYSSSDDELGDYPVRRPFQPQLPPSYPTASAQPQPRRSTHIRPAQPRARHPTHVTPQADTPHAGKGPAPTYPHPHPYPQTGPSRGIHQSLAPTSARTRPTPAAHYRTRASQRPASASQHAPAAPRPPAWAPGVPGFLGTATNGTDPNRGASSAITAPAPPATALDDTKIVTGNVRKRLAPDFEANKSKKSSSSSPLHPRRVTRNTESCREITDNMIVVPVQTEYVYCLDVCNGLYALSTVYNCFVFPRPSPCFCNVIPVLTSLLVLVPLPQHASPRPRGLLP